MVQNRVSQGAKDPPGRAICRDAVGTSKNGGYVSESLWGATYSVAPNRATLESRRNADPGSLGGKKPQDLVSTYYQGGLHGAQVLDRPSRGKPERACDADPCHSRGHAHAHHPQPDCQWTDIISRARSGGTATYLAGR